MMLLRQLLLLAVVLTVGFVSFAPLVCFSAPFLFLLGTLFFFSLLFSQPTYPQGHAFEGRLYAEVPHKDFLPATGTVQRWVVPAGATAFAFDHPPGGGQIRVDSGVQEGDLVCTKTHAWKHMMERCMTVVVCVRRVQTLTIGQHARGCAPQVGVFYDPMIAKVLATGPDRSTALATLRAALREMMIAGLPTNQELMLRIAEHPDFVKGAVNTSFIQQHKDTLLHSPAPPVAAVALAWLVGYVATLQRMRAAYGATPGMGAWHMTDSKRLNHVHHAVGRLQHPLSGAWYRVEAVVHPDGHMELCVNQVCRKWHRCSWCAVWCVSCLLDVCASQHCSVVVFVLIDQWV